MEIRLWIRGLPLLAGLGVVHGCGGAPAPAKPPVMREEPMAAREETPTVAISSETGALNEDQVTRVFENALPGLEACLKAGARRNEYLGGEVGFYLAINQSGKVAQRSLEQSSLGDQETEKCLLAVLEKQTWPKPVGGKLGKVRKSFTFDPPGGVRPPIDWDPDEVQKTLAKISKDIESCKKGNRGDFTATLYVRKDGRPLAAGVTSPTPEGEAAADCLVSVLMDARYPSPGSWAAKVKVAL